MGGVLLLGSKKGGTMDTVEGLVRKDRHGHMLAVSAYTRR